SCNKENVNFLEFRRSCDNMQPGQVKAAAGVGKHDPYAVKEILEKQVRKPWKLSYYTTNFSNAETKNFFPTGGAASTDVTSGTTSSWNHDHGDGRTPFRTTASRTGRPPPQTPRTRSGVVLSPGNNHHSAVRPSQHAG
ncbi:unnamed protein product, partial [Amoebophrya sp. A120]